MQLILMKRFDETGTAFMILKHTKFESTKRRSLRNVFLNLLMTITNVYANQKTLECTNLK